MTEHPLPGGRPGVVRVGGTVRRPAGPWTPAVQRLLQVLVDAGVDVAPRPLGRDEHGREVVAHVQGVVPHEPVPAWARSDALLADVGRALRAVHDATAGAALPRDGWRRPAVEPVEAVCHADAAPYNAVCREGRLIALVDWDFAVPAPRGWDLGYSAYRWVPLTPETDAAERDRRLRLLCDAYGGAEPDDVTAWAVRRLVDMVDLIRREADAGDTGFAAARARGDDALYAAHAAWLRELLPVG